MPEEALRVIKKLKLAVMTAKNPLTIPDLVVRTKLDEATVRKWLEIIKTLESELFHVTALNDQVLVVPTTHAREKKIVNAPDIRGPMKELFLRRWYDWRRVGHYPLLAEKIKAELETRYPGATDLPVRRKAYSYLVEKYIKFAGRHMAHLLATEAYAD